MKQKHYFEIIGTLIVLSLTALLLLQGYWLKDMYKSVKQQNRKEIHEAAEMADYKELFLRMHTDTVKKTFNNSLTFNLSQDISSTPPKKPFEDLADYLQFIKDVPYFMLQSFHKSIDTLIPLNYNIFDSLLTAELAQRNIHTKVITRLYTNKELQKSIVHNTLQQKEFSGAYCFAYLNFSKVPHQYLHIYILNPDKQILAQMRGILTTSTLVLLLIIITFIYLFRTIMRQKTVEELKTDFTNNITHEFKTPISVSYAAIDSLLEQSKANKENSALPLSPQKITRYLTIAKWQLLHLSGLIEQLLALSVENRTTFKLNPEPVLIAEIIRQLIEQHNLCNSKPCNFSVNIPADTEIIGDRTHIYNILNNLIENAIKYCSAAVAKIEITLLQLPDKLIITISDNGIGIAPPHLKHIFDKFYRVPAGNRHNTKGYGLGLYYVKDMMERHDGSIEVKSTPGTGSQFILTFKI